MQSATATGNMSAPTALAYDVYTLRHAMALSPGDPIVKRLGNPRPVPGRAIRTRGGRNDGPCRLLDRVDHPHVAEAAGVHRLTRRRGDRRRAKGRPRPGVLGQPGERPGDNELKADLSRLLRAAPSSSPTSPGTGTRRSPRAKPNTRSSFRSTPLCRCRPARPTKFGSGGAVRIRARAVAVGIRCAQPHLKTPAAGTR